MPFRRLLPSSLLAVVLVTLPRGALAQAAPSTPPADDRVCFGFSFGQWTPALDWKSAGHAAPPDSMSTPKADGGRDWASSDRGAADTLVLYPAFWPAGVSVTLPTRALVAGDTVVGRALALVADGRRTPPQAQVRAWRVSCDRRAARP
jgi:hypothetical protein